MSTDNPYNSLGQILSEGGEIALGIALFHGWDSGKIAILLTKRLKVAPGTDTDALFALATEALNSGTLAGSEDPNAPPDPFDIPVNGGLFGDAPEGRRLHWEAEYRFGTEGEWWRISGDESDLVPIGEIFDQIAGMATANETTYRTKEGIAGDVGSIPPEIRIVLRERKF